VDGPQDLEDVTDHQRRQPQGGLVEQQQARPGHQGPPNGQHLLLPARKGAGELPPALPEDREQVEDLLQIRPRCPQIPTAPRPQPQVLLHRELREDPPALRHQHDPPRHPLLGRQGMKGTPFKDDRAGQGRQEAGDHPQGGRLPRPVRPQQGHHLPIPDLQGDLPEGEDRAVSGGDRRKGENHAHALPSPLRSAVGCAFSSPRSPR